MHNGSANAFVSTVLGSDKLVVTEKIISALASFGSAIGFGVTALLAFVDGMSQLTAVHLFIFLAVCFLFLLFFSTFLKNRI